MIPLDRPAIVEDVDPEERDLLLERNLYQEDTADDADNNAFRSCIQCQNFHRQGHVNAWVAATAEHPHGRPLMLDREVAFGGLEIPSDEPAPRHLSRPVLVEREVVAGLPICEWSGEGELKHALAQELAPKPRRQVERAMDLPIPEE